MKNGIEAMITDITATTAEAEDYTGEDGLLYCGKCHTPKEAYFSKETAQWLGHDRHPTECDCQRAAREKREAAESRQKHLETVEDLKRRGFIDPAMRNWTFVHDNGRNPQTATARFYVESWETMQAENIGYLFWGCLLYTSSLDYLMNEKFVQFAASEPDEEYPFTVCGQTVLLLSLIHI